MSNLWYILNKSEHQQRLNQQIQQQLRQQLELPPSAMSSERFNFPSNNGQPTTSQINSAGTAPPPSRDILPFGQPQFPPQHAEIPFDPNAPAPPTGESHNNIEWKYHTHRPEADGDSLGRKAGKRKLVIPRDLLKMKQMNAALKIGIPPSTFSKRWRESLPDRTWPYRNHRRIEKNIKMLKAMQQKGHDVTEELGRMQQQQEENLSPAVIDVYEDVNEEYLMKVDDKKWPTAAAPGPVRAPGSGPPTPHHHPYAPPQLPPSSQPPQPQLQITAIPHSQLAHPLTIQQLPHSPTSQPKLMPGQPHPQQSQAHPPMQTTPLQASLQSSPIQASPIPSASIQSATLQSPPTLPSSVQTSPIQTSPIQAPIQTTAIQTSPIQATPLQSPPQQIQPPTQQIQQQPIQIQQMIPQQQQIQQQQIPQQQIPQQQQQTSPHSPPSTATTTTTTTTATQQADHPCPPQTTTEQPIQLKIEPQQQQQITPPSSQTVPPPSSQPLPPPSSSAQPPSSAPDQSQPSSQPSATFPHSTPPP